MTLFWCPWGSLLFSSMLSSKQKYTLRFQNSRDSRKGNFSLMIKFKDSEAFMCPVCFPICSPASRSTPASPKQLKYCGDRFCSVIKENEAFVIHCILLEGFVIPDCFPLCSPASTHCKSKKTENLRHRLFGRNSMMR